MLSHVNLALQCRFRANIDPGEGFSFLILHKLRGIHAAETEVCGTARDRSRRVRALQVTLLDECTSRRERCLVRHATTARSPHARGPGSVSRLACKQCIYLARRARAPWPASRDLPGRRAARPDG